jgi:hypothetical protein
MAIASDADMIKPMRQAWNKDRSVGAWDTIRFKVLAAFAAPVDETLTI